MNSADVPLGLGSKRASPDRLPMENFGIPNKIYVDNSEPNTPVTVKHINGDSDSAAMWYNSNHNNGIDLVPFSFCELTVSDVKLSAVGTCMTFE